MVNTILNATEEEVAGANIKEAEQRRLAVELIRPFNPRAEVSADAQYLWKRIFIWFWVVPVIVGLLAYLVEHG